MNDIIQKIIISIQDPMNQFLTGALGIISTGVSLKVLLDYGTTILGFIGALFGAITAVGSFWLFFKYKWKKQKEIKDNTNSKA